MFSGLILGSSAIIQAYRNKSNPFDFTLGGAISGAILRMHYGLYNLITGAVVGGIFGSIFGALRYTQLIISNETYEDRHYNELKDRIITREILKYSISRNQSNHDSTK